MNKCTVQRAINARLSGIEMRPENRAAVLLRIREERKVMKKKLSLAFVLMILCLVLMAGIALAFHANLFSLFANENPPLQYVAEHAQTPSPETVSTQSPAEKGWPISIDSTYYDGTSLYLSYRLIDGDTHMESFAPTEVEFQEMQREESMMVPMLREANPVMNQFFAARDAGTSYGFHYQSIGRSDHITTDDGIDLPWARDEATTDGKDLLCYIEFTSPLPAEVIRRDALTLQLRFFINDLYIWFDGENYYSRQASGQEFSLSVLVKKGGGDAPCLLSGQGEVGGKNLTLTAEITPLYIRLVYPGNGDYEFMIIDPSTGKEARATAVQALSDGMVEQLFDGFGTVPQELQALPVHWSEEGGWVTMLETDEQAIPIR